MHSGTLVHRLILFHDFIHRLKYGIWCALRWVLQMFISMAGWGQQWHQDGSSEPEHHSQCCQHPDVHLLLQPPEQTEDALTSMSLWTLEFVPWERSVFFFQTSVFLVVNKLNHANTCLNSYWANSWILLTYSVQIERALIAYSGCLIVVYVESLHCWKVAPESCIKSSRSISVSQILDRCDVTLRYSVTPTQAENIDVRLSQVSIRVSPGKSYYFLVLFTCLIQELT